ncbi:MAG: hypothetical protein ACRDJO_11380 [Actinomycetota bacterium]
MYVIDMRHYEGVDQLDGPRYGPAKRFAAYVGHIVGAATATPPGQILCTPLPCRRRPGRRLCPGRLLVRRTDAPRQIAWRCPACSEEGVIRNWHGTMWDLSPPLTLGDAPKAAVLDIDQYRQLLSIRVLDNDALRILHAAQLTDEGVLLIGGEDDLDYLMEFVAAEANHELNRRRQAALDEILGVLSAASTSA